MWKKIVMGVLVVISGLAGFLVAKAQVTLYHSMNQINRDYDTVLENVDLEGIKVNSDDDIINILVIGNDARTEKSGFTSAGLTDTMIIATMDLKHNTLKTASLMRDLYVEIPGYGYNKLNAANSFGGMELLYRTIAQNFNIELDGYVNIGFKAFADVVDAVGGVEAELTESETEYLNTTNYIRNKKYRNVKPGKQTLNGAQALGYCRIRKKGITINGLANDYGRTWRQRTILNAVFDKVKKMPYTEWVEIANKVLKHIKTDLSNEKIISYATDGLRMGTTTIYQLQIPVEGYYRGSRNGEFRVGSCLVMTDGVNSTWDNSANAEALNQFVFKYDGKEPFQYGTYISK